MISQKTFKFWSWSDNNLAVKHGGPKHDKIIDNLLKITREQSCSQTWRELPQDLPLWQMGGHSLTSDIITIFWWRYCLFRICQNLHYSYVI